jgi:GNAT superfamily N-acetyltransferase
MATRIRILSPAEAPAFAGMTFPSHAAALLRGVGTGRALAVGAYEDGRPAALALARATARKRGALPEAELLSLLVERAHRGRGLGGHLLRTLERALAGRGVGQLRTVWSDGLEGAAPFRAVLARAGWSEPRRRMYTLRMHVPTAIGEAMRREYARFADPVRCLPRGYAISSWEGLPPEDEAFIRRMAGQPGWHEHRADPLRERRTLDPAQSLLLRLRGRAAGGKGGGAESGIVGWITRHRTAPDTLRITDVFLREDLRRAGGVAMALTTHAILRQRKLGPERLTLGIEAANEPLIRLVRRRIGPVSSECWSWGAGKFLAR